MIRSGVKRGASVIFLVVLGVHSRSQELAYQSTDQVTAEATKLYADAHPYLDASLPELTKAVHQLNGMTPASSQEQLPDLLDQVGAKAAELLQRVPDLVSDEAVNRTQRAIPKGKPLGCIGKGCTLPAPRGAEEEEIFQYLVLAHPGAFGRVAHSEARLTRKGKSVDPLVEPPNFPGFLSAWVLFYPINQVESRFRYLGRQQIDGHSTFVIGFTQLPGSISSLDRPILLQGIAWIDQSDFRIVRLHTDLLAPIPAKKLQKQTTDIVFGPVELTEPPVQLWLPDHVDFEMEANGQIFHEEHKFSDYRQYKPDSTAVLLLASSPGPKETAKDKIQERMETKLYADAHPYMDEPLSELKKTMHELSGLTPASGEDQLPTLLAKTGAKADELLHRVPNLISDEAVSESHYSQAATNGCVGLSCMSPGDLTLRDANFHYMILAHGMQGGQLEVSEYRTARNGKVVGTGAAGAPSFQGFVSAWVVFSSANQTESRFRYLGKQRINDQETYVLGFAQTPGSVESPGQIVVDNESVPMLLQGIAWVDQSDFRIVRLRTDLLAPLPQILIEKQTANILFGAVHIADHAVELWLPKAVNLEMVVRGQVVQEKHNYSKYRLYQAKSRIVLSPENEPATR